MSTTSQFKVRLLLPLLAVSLALAEPPPQPAVNPGEFEPMSGVIIAFPPPLPMSLVAEMSEEANVMSVVPDTATMLEAIVSYGNNGVNLNNCTFLICPSDASLCRDNGPWYIFDGDGFQGIVDNINGLGTPIDSLPWYIGDSLNIPVYNSYLTAQGGNWMSDGMGTAMASGMLYAQNGSLTPAQIQDRVNLYLGIDNLIVTNGYGGYDNAHIDTWAKFLDPGRIIVKRYNPPVAEIEALAHYISTLKSSYGRAYDVLRIDNDYTTAYTNSLFLNNKVLVPTNGGTALDRLAIATYQEAMPGYEVLGFGPAWGPGNALHCRTMGITDRYMLRIQHIPIFDQENFGQSFTVNAIVHAYSNAALTTGMPQVYWKTEGGNYNIISMTHTIGDSFTVAIPPQPEGTDIYYYLHAEDSSGRSENHPYIGPGNPHHFYTGEDTENPAIQIELPSTLLPNNLPLTATAEVRDNRWISAVSLEYMVNGVPIDTLEMTLQPLSAVIYEAEIDPEAVSGDQIQVRVKAVDNSVNQNTTYSPEAGYYQINIVGTLGICVWNPCGQPSGELIYEYLQRAGLQCYYTEEEPVVFNRYTNMFICFGSWPNAYSYSLAQVNKIADYIQCGHCVYLEGTDAFAYGPYHTQLAQAFNIIGIWDGPIVQSVSPLLGVAGTFTEGMSFNSSDQHYVDRIGTMPGSQLIFTHADTGFGVIHTGTNYKTVGLSVEFGSLSGNNAISTKPNLLRQILHYFRGNEAEDEYINLDGDEDPFILHPSSFVLSAYPNPFNQQLAISFEMRDASEIKLAVYDILGREVQVLEAGCWGLGKHIVVWNASEQGSGVYFVRLEMLQSVGTMPHSQTRKVVLLK